MVKCNIFWVVFFFILDVWYWVRDIEINEIIMIWFIDINFGLEINVLYFVMYGDNSEVVVICEMFVNYLYGLYGFYIVNIIVINDVFSFNISINIKVYKLVLMFKGVRMFFFVVKLYENVIIIIVFFWGLDFVC